MAITEGISYNCNTSGINNGRILIFFPGIGAFKENYQEHLVSFLTHYSHIYSVDLPEQGSEGKWRIGTIVDSMARFIRTIDNENITQIDLAGHSAGALAVISFLAGYGSATESKVLSALPSPGTRKFDDRINDILRDTVFAVRPAEAAKVRKAFLYAPPVSIDAVLSVRQCIRLRNMNASRLKFLLDAVVNRPMKFLELFKPNKYYKFSLDRSGKIQLYSLLTDDHTSLLDYFSMYPTLFELCTFLDPVLKKSLEEALRETEILIQYGGNDWVIKRLFRRNRLMSSFQISGSTDVICHRFLGHLLNKGLRPDINLNLQAVTSKRVIMCSFSRL